MRLLFVALLFSLNSYAQFSGQFDLAYSKNPFVPKGILEAVSFGNTHIREITTQDVMSCTGMPRPYGVMGLFDDGFNYFKENGNLVAELSSISVNNQKASIQNQIMAYAKTFDILMQEEVVSVSEINDPRKIYSVLIQLSEIPDSGLVNLYARDAQVYQYLNFMNQPDKANTYNFPLRNFDLGEIFGEENFKVLSSKKVIFSPEGIKNEKHESFRDHSLKSTQYGPALWNPAASCNYSSRSGTAISAITIHTIQGTYAGAISWAQNCASSVSYHYVVRSSDGQITQMVLEEYKAWHVGSENPYTIGYEHDGYVDDPSWYTEDLYQASADLSRDITNSGYGIPPLRTYYGTSSAGTQTLGACTKIKGHQHYPSQSHTDPGINWNWEKYYRLINNNPSVNTITSSSGNFYDTGGSAGNYSDDERTIWTISPPNAISVSLNFTQFNCELNYDYLFIYDGSSVASPLIGTFTGTNSPGIINSTSGSLTLEFRSDCATISSGWEAGFTSVISDVVPPQTVISPDLTWKTEDFNVAIVDTDDQSVLSGKFYLVADKNSPQNGWKASGTEGFTHEDFQDDISSWTQQTGTFTLNAHQFQFSNTAETNSNAYISCVQGNTGAYVYEWDQNITSSGTNQRAGLHFFCDDPTLPNRGNSYFVYFREGTNKAQIYKVVNDVYTLETNDTCVVNENTVYNYRVWYDPNTGWIKVFADGLLVTSWQDLAPLQNGNSVSLRSGGCAVAFDNIRTYRSRSGDVLVDVQNEMRYQSNASQPSGKVFSLAIDGNNNWSEINSQEFLVDWTEPQIDLLADGSSLDIDTSYSITLNGNWSVNDPNSSIAEYVYAIGTNPYGNEIVDWTSVSLNTSLSHVLSTPVYDQVYFISLRAINGAGLSTESTTDGQRLVDASANLQSEFLEQIQIYPIPASDKLYLSNLNKSVEIFLYTNEGKLVKQMTSDQDTIIDLQAYATGSYRLVLFCENQFIVKQIEIIPK